MDELEHKQSDSTIWSLLSQSIRASISKVLSAYCAKETGCKEAVNGEVARRPQSSWGECKNLCGEDFQCFLCRQWEFMEDSKRVKENRRGEEGEGWKEGEERETHRERGGVSWEVIWDDGGENPVLSSSVFLCIDLVTHFKFTFWQEKVECPPKTVLSSIPKWRSAGEKAHRRC